MEALASLRRGLIGSGVDIYPPLSTALPETSPVVILNHGLTGGSHESYVRNMVLHIAKPWALGGLGGRVAVVNVSWSHHINPAHLPLMPVPRLRKHPSDISSSVQLGQHGRHAHRDALPLAAVPALALFRHRLLPRRGGHDPLPRRAGLV